jgi:hypothetical protein
MYSLRGERTPHPYFDSIALVNRARPFPHLHVELVVMAARSDI